MIVTLRNSGRVKFPVYKLPSDNWEVTDGLLFIDGQLYDDKNVDDPSLGMRRLKSPFQSRMARLNKSIPSMAGLSKNPGNRPYIDSRGMCFIYEKTKMYKVIYHKIEKVIPKGNRSVLILKGLNEPFAIPRPPHPSMEYAGIIYIDKLPFRLFEYSEDEQEPRRVKI